MSEKNDGVPGVPPTPASEGVNPQPQPAPQPVPGGQAPATPQPGSQTPPENLLAALQEERKEKESWRDRALSAEDKLNQPNGTVLSEEEEEEFEEGDGELEQRVKQLEAENAWQKAFTAIKVKFPDIDESDFKEFAKGKGSNLMEIAEFYVFKKGGTPQQPERKGLEQPSGGGQPTPSTLSAEDIANLRKNYPRKYEDMIRNGLIRPQDIK